MRANSAWPTLAVSLIAEVIIASLGLTSRAMAQARPTPRFDSAALPNRTPVVIAVTDNIPDGDQDILIVRRVSVTPHDVILVRPRSLTPAALARAVHTLQAARGRLGRVPVQDAWIRIDTKAEGSPPRANEAVNWVDALRSVKPMSLPGVGLVPLIMLHPSDDEIPQ